MFQPQAPPITYSASCSEYNQDSYGKRAEGHERGGYSIRSPWS